MGKAFIIDTRESVFTIRESEVIEIVDMTLRCRVEGEVFNVKRGNYFATKEKAEEKLEEIIYIGKYKARKKDKRTNTWKCAYCGKVIYNKADVTVDHITPKSRGGKTTDDNLTICCKSCNTLKSSKTKERYVRLLKANSKRKARNSHIYKRKIRYSAYNRHGKNIESVARMDGTNISIKYIGHYANVVDRALAQYNLRNVG